MTEARWNDERMELIIGRLLRAGVLIAATVVAIGGAWYLVQHGGAEPRYGVFRGEPSELRNVSGILSGVRTLHARSIIQLGLLLLIATPVSRVAFAAAAFALERDRTYVLITLVVLGILIYSLAGGGAP